MAVAISINKLSGSSRIQPKSLCLVFPIPWRAAGKHLRQWHLHSHLKNQSQEQFIPGKFSRTPRSTLKSADD